MDKYQSKRLKEAESSQLSAETWLSKMSKDNSCLKKMRLLAYLAFGIFIDWNQEFQVEESDAFCLRWLKISPVWIVSSESFEQDYDLIVD